MLLAGRGAVPRSLAAFGRPDAMARGGRRASVSRASMLLKLLFSHRTRLRAVLCVESTEIRACPKMRKAADQIHGLVRLLAFERWVKSKCAFARSAKGRRSSPIQATLTHLC